MNKIYDEQVLKELVNAYLEQQSALECEEDNKVSHQEHVNKCVEELVKSVLE